MKKSFFLLAVLCFSIMAFAQNNFVIQNNSSKVYKSLSEAIDASVNGDTIYLPEGAFNSPGTITKSLVWIGVGHYPTGSQAAGTTQITGNITFTGTCDGTYITGIYFTGYLYLGNSGDNVEDVTISRCRIDGDLKLKYGTENAPINFTLSECITKGNIKGNNAADCLIEKSILSGSRKSISNIDQSQFDRLIHTSPATDNNGNSISFSSVTNSLITNSIFNQTYNRWAPSNCSGNNFTYNLILPGIYVLTGNLESNNITSTEPFVSIFTTVDDITSFSYNDDFHLKTGVTGTAASEDGTDLGIYGSNQPYKENGLPFTPHISSKSIGTETVNGMLSVEINVSAQER